MESDGEEEEAEEGEGEEEEEEGGEVHWSMRAARRALQPLAARLALKLRQLDGRSGMTAALCHLSKTLSAGSIKEAKMQRLHFPMSGDLLESMKRAGQAALLSK